MSTVLQESHYLLQTFHFSHQENDGNNVYYGKTEKTAFKPESSGLLGTTVWSASGPVHIQLRSVDAPSKGGMIQLQGKECEILLQKDYTPLWLTVFNFVTHPLILIPVHQDYGLLSDIQRIPTRKSNTDESKANLERLTSKYHVIIPSRPGRTPSPRPLSPLDYLQAQAA